MNRLANLIVKCIEDLSKILVLDLFALKSLLPAAEPWSVARDCAAFREIVPRPWHLDLDIKPAKDANAVPHQEDGRTRDRAKRADVKHTQAIGLTPPQCPKQ